MRITEIIGIVALALGVLGVLLNNRKLRACFIVWMISNALSAGIHISSEIWSLFLRDAVFFILSIEGWLKWGKKSKNG